MDGYCSGRRLCEVSVADKKLMETKPCEEPDYTSYLRAEYVCLSGMYTSQLSEFTQCHLYCTLIVRSLLLLHYSLLAHQKKKYIMPFSKVCGKDCTNTLDGNITISIQSVTLKLMKSGLIWATFL